MKASKILTLTQRSGARALALFVALAPLCLPAAPLTTLTYHLTGTELRVSPAVVSVPKGIAGSVLVQLVGADGTNGATAELAQGAYVEATLRGPSFDARRVVGAVNAAMLLPPLNLVGDYQLDNIRLVDAVTGAVRLEGNPSSVPVRVFDEVLVTKVTSRPLTYEEIQEKGIYIDEQNFRAIEFEAAFVVDGKTIPVKFPVVAPVFQQNTELIPKAELEAKLAEAQIINQGIAATAVLPPELETASFNIHIEPVLFQEVQDVEEDLELKIPPIPALVVIPGNIGFLNQFFSVMVLTENAAPSGSGLSAHNIRAHIVLPSGPDHVPAPDYSHPGDDPLRLARVGPDKATQPTVLVVRPGQDGQFGTSDDISRLQPGEQGQGEFLVEGLQEGLHVMDINLTADLDGLAAGTVSITGKAAGSVLVRNPKFSMAFTHPRTVRAGEEYDASVTILNTGTTPANQVSVTLAGASLSGGVLLSEETILLGNLEPGQSATATWRVRSQRTGAISFSNLTTGNNSVEGRFRFTVGVDERGVALSPDTLAMPSHTQHLPPAILNAAQRVLGQALSIATAGQLPPGVKGVPKSIITRRVLELAEAGQRLAYGDATNRVLADVLLDWQGARSANEGFDEILRVTNAGREWREAVMTALDAAEEGDATTRLLSRSLDMAGRGETWKLAASSTPAIELSLRLGDAQAVLDRSDLPFAAAYRGLRGHWLVSPPIPSPLAPLPSDGRGETNCVFEWKAVEAVDSAELAALLLSTNGTVRQLRWSVSNVVAGTRFRLPISDTAGNLQVDANADGQPDGALTAAIALVTERPPEFISVQQDTTVNSGRPSASCLPANAENYGTVVAVLFSKPMRQEDVSAPGAYVLDNGITASTVQIQPGGRVALLNLKQGISAIRPRAMTVSGVRDPRGHLLAATTRPVLTDFYSGSTLYGRVVRADGSPATNVPVTLTMYDQKLVGNTGDCLPHTVRVSQVFTDTEGKYAFDFVLAGIPYSVSATDTSGLSDDEVGAVTESTVGGEVSRSRLESWLQNAINRNPLFGMFSVSTLPEAIAKVDGLDRAMLRDLIPLGSAREGGETPIALRFRGRGAITGQVLASDGVTPVPRAAVNLYPDPGSRELPRGVFSDSNGRFAFVGVPLGVFSINAQSSAGQYRTVGVELLDIDETKEVPIVLAAPIVQRTGLRGRVFESDGETPHARARVFVGKYDAGGFGAVVAAVDADLDGFWSATNIVAGTYDVVAVSFDGRRKGDRREIAAPAGEVGYVSVSLQGTAIVKGKVEFATGKPAAGAIVAGGEVLVYTDANGLFTLTGVPTGLRTISAGLARNPAAGILTPRIGSASVNVVPGADNGVLIRFDSRGRIVGTVYDATGTNPVPNVRVAIPGEGGFMYVDADSRGRYAFENMGMGGYTLSAPAGPVALRSTGHLVEKIKSGTEEEVEAAIGEAFAIFTGAANPYLNGAGANFNPNTWGFTSARLEYDGQTVQANIIYLRQGTVAGKVVNGQGVPIGAKVLLTGVAPMPNGAPGTRIRGEMNSDPATGEFRFPNAVFEGLWQLQAASPFYPSVVTHSDLSFPPANLDHTNIVLAFPPVREVNGRLIGHVLNPDGTPAGTNVSVRISFGDLTVRTVEDGFFDTQLAIPAGSYSVIATNEEGLVGIAGVSVTAGITNACTVRLLGKGALRVTVRHANGVIATNARVEIAQGGFPNDTAATPPLPEGEFLFANLFEGSYGVQASKPSGPVTIRGRAGATVTPGETNAVTVVLQSTASICGRFLKRDGVTPIYAAQVAIGNIGFAITDTNGAFTVDGVPLGTYRIVSQDPVNGWGAQTYVTLSVDGECRQLTLLEQSRGELWGYVINSYATGYVPGALVNLAVFDGLTPPRQVTTGPDGLFRFPATPAGEFTVSAFDNVTRRGGSTSGTLPENTSSMQVDVPLQPLVRLAGYVYLPDGTQPANARVEISGPDTHLVGFTDPAGRVAFADLPLGAYTLRATDTRTGFERSLALTQTDLNQMGQAPDFRLQLSGVGRVAGALVFSDGVRPMQAAVVTLVHQAPAFAGQRDTTFTDAQGRFAFDNVPVGPYALTAEFFALGAAHAGAIARSGQTDFVTMRLGDSGEVVGQLFRADGVTAVTNLDVWLAFQSQSTVPGYAIEQTGSDGSFHFFNIPVGEFTFHAVAYDFDGLALQRATLWFNLQVLNLGIITLDEAPPTVESVFPADGSSRVPAGVRPVLTFSEALDSTTLDDRGLYLHSRHGDVPVTLQLEQTNGVARRVRIVPLQPLASETTYDLVVLHRPYRGGRVVTDLVGRPLSTPLVARFTTQDTISPTVVSVFPTNGAVQVDPRAVVRVSFNEPVQNRHIQCALVGPGGPVPGQVSVGFNGLVVVFVPDAPLAVNARHTLQLSGVLDLAGNPMAPALVESSFDTLDTTGPAIQILRLADGRLPVAGATVPFEAVLTVDEPGASVRFTRDFQPAGLATRAPYRANITLPASGSTTLRAYASDRYGNEGEFAELTVAVVSNASPVVNLSRVLPASGPVGSSRSFTLRLGATDDYVVTNVTVVFSGALNEVRRFDTGDARDVEATVPAEAVAGATLRVSAQALDGLGTASEVATLDLTVEDRSAPALQFVAPAAGALLDPAQPLVLQVAASDNGTNYFVEAALGGALTASQSTNIIAATNQPVSAAFTFNLAGAQTNGDALFVSLRGWDTLGNTGLVTRTYRLPDRAPPRLLAVTPTNGAPAQSLWLDTVRFEFSEAIASNSLTTARLTFTNNAGLPVGHRVALEADARFARLNPTNLPLAPGVTFTNLLLSGVTDLDGNALVQTNGDTWPAEGAAWTFTTAVLLEVSPTNDQPVVPGQLFAARLGFERGLGADFIRFALNTNPPVEAALAPDATNAAVALRLPTNATSASLVIAAHKSGRAPYTLPAVALQVRPRSADDDGDGWNNGYEADRGMNPFVAEPDGADPDGDSLVNADERARGTDPSNPDTDDDGLRDGAEIALGTNPLDPDTDHDSLPDGSDPDPLRGDSAPVIAAPAQPATMEVIQGRLTNVTVSASDPDLNLRELQALAASTKTTLRWAVNDSAEERVLDEYRVRGATLGQAALGSLAWWRANGDAQDAAGTFHGTLQNGATFAAGKVEQAFAFDGSDDYVQVGSPAALAFSSRWSFAAWIFPTGTGSGGGNGGILINKESAYEIARFGNGTIQWAFANSNPGWTWVDTGAVAPLNQWSHVAVTYDSGIAKTYLDGVLVHTYNGSGPIGNAGGEFRIGGRQATSQYFAGRMDEVLLFDRALRPDEVSAAVTGSAQAGDCRDCVEPLAFASAPVLPGTLLGQSYGQSLLGNGGVSPYTFAVVNGALPGGLTLSPDGWLSGTATNAGFATFTVRVTDALGQSAGQLFGLRVADGALPPTNAAPHVLTLATNAAQITTPLLLSALAPGTSTVQIIARDVTGLRSTNTLTLVALADADLDGLPDRDDPDADGDGLANAIEIAQGTDPLKADTDGDGIPDNLDAAPTQPNQPPVPVFSEGRPALLLDGVDDFAQKDNPSLAVNIGRSNFTVSAWVQTTNRVEAYQCVVSRYEFGWGASDGNAQAIWVIYVNPEGKPMFGVRGDTGPWLEAVGSSDVRDGQWHHLAGVLDRIAGTLMIYVDGVPAATNAATDIGPVNDSGSPLSVGRIFRQGWGSPGEYYMGAIADLRIWAAARTPAELQNDMTQPPPPGPLPLHGYWTFEEPYASPQAADRTTNGNHLALGGGAHLRRIVPQTGTAPHVFTLTGTDPDGDSPRAVLTALPPFGALFQTSDGVTPGARITNAPALMTDPAGRVILVPTPGARRDYDFRWKLTDSHAWSAEMAARLEVRPLGDVDTDGDGLPDAYEFAHLLDPEADDSGADLDGDGLTNEREFLLGTRPDVADTDNDWSSDGLEMARGTDPFQRDSDGDGLVDSEDPQPTNLVAGVTFTAPSEVTLDAGGSTNIAFTATCPGAPIALADFWPTNLPPAFASLLQFRHTNDGPNGVIHGVLALNPLHDALGEHVISLRAAGKNGMSGGWDLKVTVVEGARIDVTSWYEPVSGNWNDPTRWTAGVPDATKFAVINATGATYTVTLNTSAACRGLVVDAPKVTLHAPEGGRSISGPVELRQGRLTMVPSSVLNLGRSFYNGGMVRMSIRPNGGEINGTGWIENRGLFELVAVSAAGWWGTVAVPFRNAGNGRLVVREGGRLDIFGPVISSGTIEAESGGELRLKFNDANPPYGGLLVHSGCQVLGTGALMSGSGSKVFMAGDMTTTNGLAGSGYFTGFGTLTLDGPRNLKGDFNCLVVFGGNTRAGTHHGYFGGDSPRASIVVFRKPVAVQPGAELTVIQGGQMDVQSTLDNYGTIRVASEGSFSSYGNVGCDVGVLSGSGTITNHALLEIYDAADTAGQCPGGSSSARAALVVNVTVPAGGQLLVGSNAWVRVAGLRELRIGGQFEFQSGGWLALESGRLVLEEGVRVEGPGSIDIGGANLVMEGNATVACPLNFSRSTHHSWPFVQGSGVLTLEGPQGLYGAFACPVVFSGTVRASTYYGYSDISLVHFMQPAVVMPGAELTVHQGGQMDVQSTLDNYGTIRVASEGSFSSYGNVGCDVGVLSGSGTITNHALLEIYDAADTAGQCPGGSSSARAALLVNVTVPAGGQLLVGSNAWVRVAGLRELRIGGQFEFQSGGWLALEFGRLVLEEGVRVEGPGSLSIGDELVVEGNATIACPLSMMGAYGGRTASGNGTLTLEGPQSLSGIFNCPVVFASTARAATYFGFVGSGIPYAGTIVRFNQPVVILPGAEVTIHQTGQLSVSSTLDNYGTIRISSMGSSLLSGSAGHEFGTLTGSGRLINHTLLEVFDATNAVAGWSGVPAVVDLNLTLPVGGRLLLSDGAQLSVSGGKEIRLGTPLESVAGGSPPVGGNGAPNGRPQVDGSGSVKFEPGSRLVMDGDAASSCGLTFGVYRGMAPAVGNGVLTLTRSQTLNGSFDCPVVLASGVQAGVQPGNWWPGWYRGDATVWFNRSLTIHEGAVLEVSNLGILNVGDVLENHGTIRLASNGEVNAGGLSGPGRILNHGLLEVYDLPQTSGNPQVAARLNSDLTELAGSRLVVGTNASAVAEASRTLRVAGQMEIQPGGSLALDAGQLALEAGVRVAGAGVLNFRGGSQLVMDGDATIACALNLGVFGPCLATGDGVLTLEGSQHLVGRYSCPVVLASNLNAYVDYTFSAPVTFSNKLTMVSNAVLRVERHGRLHLNCLMENAGHLRLESRGFASAISTYSEGCVRNSGLIEVFATGAANEWSEIHVPLVLGPSGRLLVNTNAQLHLSRAATLALAGRLEVAPGARFVQLSSPTPLDLILYAGARLGGGGLMELHPGGRLVVLANATIESGQLRLLGSTTMAGRGRLLIEPDAEFYVDHSLAFPGSIETRGLLRVASAPVVFQTDGTFILAASGTLNNPGTVRVGSYVNFGGTIIGNAPVLIGGSPGEVARITRLSLGVQDSSAASPVSGVAAPAPAPVVLTWTAPPATSWTVETSADLTHWSAVPATITETTPGNFEARLAPASAVAAYYRVRLSPSP